MIKQIDFTKPLKILVVDLAYIGDMVMSTPALCNLRKALPSARIDLLVSPGCEILFNGNGDIDQLYTTSIKKGGLKAINDEASRIEKRNYDIGICFHRGHGSLLMLNKSGIPMRIGFTNGGRQHFLSDGVPYELYKHRTWNHLNLLEKSFGLDIDYNTPTKVIPDDKAVLSVMVKLRNISADIDVEKIVVVNPNAAWESKRWEANKFSSVADYLAGMCYIPALIGAKNEMSISEQVLALSSSRIIDLTGKTSLEELIGLLSIARFVVTNDSGPMHIAGGLGKSVISIFGPTDPCRCSPWLGIIPPLQSTIDCIKCYRKTCWHMRCMREVTTEDVINRITCA